MAQSNILVHLAPCEIRVNFAEVGYTIPAMNAHQWLQILLSEPFDPYDVFPLLAGESAIIGVEDAIDHGQQTGEDLTRIAFEVVTIVGDRPWWVTVRMLGVAGQVWDRIGGTLVREGVDSRHLPLSAWLDAVWSILISYLDRDKVTVWLHQIETPPKGWEGEIDFDENERAFMAAMKSVR